MILPQLTVALGLGFLVGRWYGRKAGRAATLELASLSPMGIIGYRVGGRDYVVMTEGGAEAIGWRFGNFGPDGRRALKVPTSGESSTD